MMAASEPGTARRSSRRRRSGGRQFEPEEPATDDVLSSQATEDTSQAQGVSTRRSRTNRSGGDGCNGEPAQEPVTPAVPGTLRRSQRRQARQEAESPLTTANDDEAGSNKQIPTPSRRQGAAVAVPAAASAEQAAAEADGAQPAAEQSEAVPSASTGPASQPSGGRSARGRAAASSADNLAGTAAASPPSQHSAGAAAVQPPGSDSDDSDPGGPAAMELGDDLLHQLAAGMAAALAAQRQPKGGGAEPSEEPEPSETDLSDGSSSEDEDSSSGSEDERDGTSGAVPVPHLEANGLTKAERAALHWVPQSQLPALNDDETLDRLEQAARNGLAAQAKQVLAPPQDARRLAREQRKSRPDTAGDGWFDLPATQITPQVKQDLRMLALRGALDPKRFYRNPDATKFPKYFQMGTVVGGPTDFYTGRLTKKERRQTLTEELLADQALQQAHKRRFAKLQAERSKFKDKRTIAKRKTSNPRLMARRKKPKH